MKKKLVVLSGAGISAESGVPTFRDSNGLWEGHDVMEVASPEGWRKNRALVLEFYNQRRQNLEKVVPNQAHIILKELEKDFEVQIITQNVDNLHERAGSTHILHLHGQLTQARSSADENLIWDIGYQDINLGDTCPIGSQVRPNIVWFGEAVPAIVEASQYCKKADFLIVVGTSLQVYPAAGLLHDVPKNTPIFVIDPNTPTISQKNVYYFAEKASVGMQKVREKLLELV